MTDMTLSRGRQCTRYRTAATEMSNQDIMHQTHSDQGYPAIIYGRYSLLSNKYQIATACLSSDYDTTAALSTEAAVGTASSLSVSLSVRQSVCRGDLRQPLLQLLFLWSASTVRVSHQGLEWRRYCFRSMCVCVSVCVCLRTADRSIRPV